MAAHHRGADEAPAPADTLRTNIWLIEALMADGYAASAEAMQAASLDPVVALHSE